MKADRAIAELAGDGDPPRPGIDTASDQLSFDVPCAGCGYNLRTLSAGSVCPECERPVLSSIDEHLRRRMSRFELARMRDRPVKSVRSIARGACYAILANTIALTLVHMPTWMFRRRTTMRTVLLVALCIALAFAAMSIWRFAVKSRADRKLGVGPWLLRAGAIGAVAFPVFVALRNDWPTFGTPTLQWFFNTDFPWLVAAAAWLLGLGAVGRLVYSQWWLRLEGFGLIGWPLLLCALPLGFFYFFIAPFNLNSYYRGNFVSLDYFLEIPFATGSWPLAVAELERWILRYSYRRYDSAEFLMALAGLALQALVFVADATLLYLARRDLRRRRSEAAGTAGG